MGSPVRLICILLFVGFTTGEFFDDFDPFEEAVLTAKRQTWDAFQRKHVYDADEQSTCPENISWQDLAQTRLGGQYGKPRRKKQSFICVTDANDVINGFQGELIPCGKNDQYKWSDRPFDLVHMEWNRRKNTYDVKYKGLGYICVKLVNGKPVHFDSYKES